MSDDRIGRHRLSVPLILRTKEIMRNASLDSIEILIFVLVGLAILAGVGYAVCRTMGLERTAVLEFARTNVVIVGAFLLAAYLLTFFFRT